MVTQSPSQKKTVARVMHAFKHGDLEQRSGETVKSPKQAIAIALREAGASRDEDAKTSARNLRHAKRKQAEGGSAAHKSHGKSKAALYADARERQLPGRSRMTKDELAEALNQ